MKYDMAGGAAVICAMCALGALGARVRCVGVVPAVENMPGGGALRPGDVLRSAAGSTVEVVDPDAEGRLVLADGLWYARQLGATHLIDVATLTSACVAALGETASGLFGSPEGWIRSVRHAAERAGEPVWPLPLVDEEPSRLESTIADLANNAAGPGAATLAALFLREFAGGLPWAHVDIAGTAWSDYDRPFQPPGPTGVGVRTLMELALRSAESLPTRGDDEAEYTAANVTAAGGLERP
jgi:leucyl aminopeptidase